MGRFTGYGGLNFSMSDGAKGAYSDGLVPASKTGVPAGLVKEFVKEAEWHHTGKFYNETPFYDPVEVKIKFGLMPPNDDFDVDEDAVVAFWAYKSMKTSKDRRDFIASVLRGYGRRIHIEFFKKQMQLEKEKGNE